MSVQSILPLLRKEILEASREKQLRIVLLVGLLIPMLLSWAHVKRKVAEHARAIKEAAADAAVEPADDAQNPAGAADETPNERLKVKPPPAPAMDLFTILFGVGYGVFLAAIFAITLALEAFVGEKERKTMEVLLASPLTDRQLFTAKVAGCSLTSIGIGVLLSLSGSVVLVGLAWSNDLALPWGQLGLSLVYCLVLLVATSVTFASIGAIISAHVSTVKAGGQLFGVVMIVLMVPFMILPVFALSHEEAMTRAFSVLAYIPVWVYVVETGLILLLLNWALLVIGAATFDREKILTRL